MSSWNLKPSKLNIKSPVPSDIQVVRDHIPKKISVVASEIGLTEDEYSPYGHHVAKGILTTTLSTVSNDQLISEHSREEEWW